MKIINQDNTPVFLTVSNNKRLFLQITMIFGVGLLNKKKLLIFTTASTESTEMSWWLPDTGICQKHNIALNSLYVELCDMANLSRSKAEWFSILPVTSHPR